MIAKIFTLAAALALANAGYLQPALRYAAPAYHAAPLVSYTSPAITKTDFLPGSYSSSYRSDVITPRVKYTETPGLSFVAQPAPLAVARVGFAGHGYPAPLAHGLVGHGGYAAPFAHGLVGHGGYAAPFARGYNW